MIQVKSDTELEIMRKNANTLGQILGDLEDMVQPGITTTELDDYAEEAIRDQGAEPAFKNYRGFPNTLCTSVNEEIVHGIPSDQKLKDGDMISLDIGLQKDGYFADVATTVPVGQVGSLFQDMLDTAREALSRGIDATRLGNRISDISSSIEAYVQERGYYVVKEFVGHGIGRELHEDPQIPNYGTPGSGERLRKGMVFAIEPMVKAEDEPVEVLQDGWTAVTGNRGPSTHFEGMVAVTDNGPEVLVRGGG